MTATHTSNAERIGKFVAEQVRERSDVLGLWARQSGELSELWLIVDVERIDDELELRRMNRQVQERFPNYLCDLRVYDVKLMGTTDQRGFVPGNAVRIEL